MTGGEHGGRRRRVVLGEPQRCLGDARLGPLPLRPVHGREELLHAPRFAGPDERLQQVRVQQVGTFTAEMRKLRLALRQSFVERSAQGIRRMQADGIADPRLDPVMLAEVLGAMVDQTCYIWFFLGKELDSRVVVETLTIVWSRAIGVSALGAAGQPGTCARAVASGWVSVISR
ncbi:MAG: hypothetical protein ABSB76_12525 [Streptosporangiaceae bacterium]|jgi:hypothetical protein